MLHVGATRLKKIQGKPLIFCPNFDEESRLLKLTENAPCIIIAEFNAPSMTHMKRSPHDAHELKDIKIALDRKGGGKSRFFTLKNLNPPEIPLSLGIPMYLRS